MPCLAGQGIVRLELELPGRLVVAAGLGDANGVRARDARGLVPVRDGVEAGPRERREGRTVQQAFDFLLDEQSVEQRPDRRRAPGRETRAAGLAPERHLDISC